jgi:hypothetical protein
MILENPGPEERFIGDKGTSRGPPPWVDCPANTPSRHRHILRVENRLDTPQTVFYTFLKVLMDP